MIRRLDDRDRAAALALAGREPEVNLFILADIRNYGMATDFMKLWGEFSADNTLRAVMMFFQDSVTIYAPEGCDVPGFVEVIKDLKFESLSGGGRSVAPFADRLEFRKAQRTILAALKELKSEGGESEAALRPLRIEDLPQVCALYDTIEEFHGTAAESMRQELEAGNARGAWVEAEGRMVSVARSAAESGAAAMIIGVATLKAWRNRGFASAAMAGLCRSLLNDGIKPCLFYDNPAAGKIYRRLGFEQVGDYMMLRM